MDYDEPRGLAITLRDGKYYISGSLKFELKCEQCNAGGNREDVILLHMGLPSK